MDQQDKDPLNGLLQQWAGRQALGPADHKQLRDRIVRDIEAAPLLDLPPIASRQSEAWKRAAWFALGAAAAVLVMVVFRFGSKEHPVAKAPDELPTVGSSFAEISPAQLAQKSGLLAGMQETFGGCLAWISESGREVQVGTFRDCNGPLRDGQPVVLRIVVVARQSGSKDWKPVWQADTITRDEQVVELQTKPGSGGRLQFWAHRIPDGVMAVDANLSVDLSVPLQCSFSGILRPGVPQRVCASQSDDTEYQVYQTIAPLTIKGHS